MGIYFDRAGKPISCSEWWRLRKDLSYVQVVRTTLVSAADLTTTVLVSTAWLGVNTQGTTPPLIFETAVFVGDGVTIPQRYATEEWAHSGHMEEVVNVAATMIDPIVMVPDDGEPTRGEQ